MNKKEVAKIIIESHVHAVFSDKSIKVYDKVTQLPFAKENAYILVDAQIQILNEGTEVYLVNGTEGTEKNFWEDVKEEIRDFEYGN